MCRVRLDQSDRASRTACRTATHPADHNHDHPAQTREIRRSPLDERSLHISWRRSAKSDSIRRDLQAAISASGTPSNRSSLRAGGRAATRWGSCPRRLGGVSGRALADGPKADSRWEGRGGLQSGQFAKLRLTYLRGPVRLSVESAEMASVASLGMSLVGVRVTPDSSGEIPLWLRSSSKDTWTCT